MQHMLPRREVTLRSALWHSALIYRHGDENMSIYSLTETDKRRMLNFLKRILAPLLLIVTVLWSCAYQGTTDIRLNTSQSSPQAIVKLLYEATQEGDIETYRAIIDPKDPHLDEMVAGLEQALAAGYSFGVEDLEIAIVGEGIITATVRTYYAQQVFFNGTVISETETSGDIIPLVKRDNRWYVRAHGRDAWLDEPVPE